MFDGGTRVPFIISWPGRINSGISDAIICQVDLYACFASIINQVLNAEEAPDSLPLASTLLGENEIGRTDLVLEGTKAKTVLRRNNWVYIPPYEGRSINENTNIELGNSLEAQLYDLRLDAGQQKNIVSERPDIVKIMSSRLDEILSSERTRH